MDQMSCTENIQFSIYIYKADEWDMQRKQGENVVCKQPLEEAKDLFCICVNTTKALTHTCT